MHYSCEKGNCVLGFVSRVRRTLVPLYKILIRLPLKYVPSPFILKEDEFKLTDGGRSFCDNEGN